MMTTDRTRAKQGPGHHLPGVKALVAYWQAAGRPVLVPEITLPSCPPNRLEFKVAKLNEEKIHRTDALLSLPQATAADALSPV